MKALQTIKPYELCMIEVEKPSIESSTDVLVKMKAAGICGSDVHIYHGTSPVATYPRVMGHEIVGVVAEVGPAVTKVQVGDHVIIDQVTSCGECYPCRMNRPNVCCRLEVRGVHIDGGYREYVVADEKAMHILPKDLSFIDAVMIEPMSISFQAKSRAEVVDDDIVFILGTGALGKSIVAKFDNLSMTVKQFILYFYFSGLAFFIVAYTMQLGFFELGVAIALLNTAIVEVILDSIEKGNKGMEAKKIFRFKFAKNLLFSLLICYFIAWLRFVISENIVELYFEPISFGFIYSTIYVGLGMLFSTLVRGNEN